MLSVALRVQMISFGQQAPMNFETRARAFSYIAVASSLSK